MVGVVAGLGAKRSGMPRDARADGIGLGGVPKQEGRVAAARCTHTAAPRTGLSGQEQSDDDADERVSRERITGDLAHGTVSRRGCVARRGSRTRIDRCGSTDRTSDRACRLEHQLKALEERVACGGRQFGETRDELLFTRPA